MNKKFSVAIFILFLIASAVADTNGVVTTPVVGFTNHANAIAIQSDGKVIAVGSGGGEVRYIDFGLSTDIPTPTSYLPRATVAKSKESSL